MRCFICRFEIPVWYKYADEWHCKDCYNKQMYILGRYRDKVE